MCCKELAHEIVVAEKSGICREGKLEGWKLREEEMLQPWVQGRIFVLHSGGRIPFSLGEPQSMLKVFSWLDEAHIMKGNLLYSKSTDLDGNRI